MAYAHVGDKAPRKRRIVFGPGMIITAAYIGPGTVTTCTLAGASFGYSLLWTMLFSGFGVWFLQEMSGRVGLATGKGLGEALMGEAKSPLRRIASMLMVVSAIGIGAAAYETGNILGASLGLSALTGTSVRLWPPIIGVIAFFLLWFGTYKLLERVFIGLVALMCVCFIATAIVIKPDFLALLQGLFVPTLNSSNLYLSLALVGTTIAPYNLFLYASIVRERFGGIEELGTMRADMVTSTMVGILISMAIIITASAAFFGTGVVLESAGSMATQLEPLLGVWAKVAISVGLFGAGMSSAMTAPLAAAHAFNGTFRWNASSSDVRFRATWCAVLFIGAFLSSIGLRPIAAIVFAQSANGVLLPVAAIFLLTLMNSRRLLGQHTNSGAMNVAGGFVVLVTLVLGAWGLAQAFR